MHTSLDVGLGTARWRIIRMLAFSIPSYEVTLSGYDNVAMSGTGIV